MDDNIIKPIGSVRIVKQKCIYSKEHNPQTTLKKTIAKIANINATKEFIFAWQIQYKGGTRLKKEDILISKNGLRFMVNEERNRVATIICPTPMSVEPNINVTLNIYRA